MKENSIERMVDFREYLRLEDYLLEEDEDDVFLDQYEYDFDGFDYYESPFEPIEIGEYTLCLYASEQNFCTPQINSLDKYDYDKWEVSIQKNHPRYGIVICTAEVMNDLGYDKFEPNDHYVAYASLELVQTIFDYLVGKLNIPVV